MQSFRQPLMTDFVDTKFGDLVNVNYKNRNYESIKDNLSKYVQDICEVMLDNLRVKKYYQYFMISSDYTTPGNPTTNGLWHLDSSLNADHEFENQLFVTGRNNTTEFVINRIEVPRASDGKDFDSLVKKNFLETVRIVPCTITSYDGRNVHRGPFCKDREKRMLIRIINTDKQLPSYEKKKN